jgi:hypothetical protein
VKESQRVDSINPATGQPPKKDANGEYPEKWGGVKYKYLVNLSANFIVFLDDAIIIDWITSAEWDKEGPTDRKKHNAIITDAGLLETTPCDGLSLDNRINFKRLIGEAIVCSLDHDYTNARRALASAAGYIEARSQEISRFWYLSASFSMTLPFAAFGCGLWVWRDVFGLILGQGAFWVVLSSVAGSIGALLSVIGRAGKLRFSCSSGRALHYLEGASRIWAGCFSGTLAALAVRSEIILAPLSRVEKVQVVMVLAAFAAGAGERLVSSIISTIGLSEVNVGTHKRLNSERETSDESASTDHS